MNKFMNYEYDMLDPEVRQNKIKELNDKSHIKKKIVVKPMYDNHGSQQSSEERDSSAGKSKSKKKGKKGYDMGSEVNKLNQFNDKFNKKGVTQQKISFGKKQPKKMEQQQVEDFELYKIKNSHKFSKKETPCSTVTPSVQSSQQSPTKTGLDLSNLPIPENILKQIKETEQK